MNSLFARIGRALLAFTLLSTAASAERGEPASVLIFPEYHNAPGALTLITVANTNLSSTVFVEFVYVSGSSCAQTSVIDVLQPGDQLSVLTSAHNPGDDEGYVYVKARGFLGPIAFDYLVGSSLSLHALGSVYEGVEPFAYRAGAGLEDFDDTDLDGDGLLDFDGQEYEPVPNVLHFPRFLGQIPGEYESRLLLINLTGAADFDARVHVGLHNDDSQYAFTQHVFRCWDRVPLSDVSVAFDNAFLQNNTSHDPDEIVGLTSWESGWFSVDGVEATSPEQALQDPAILAVLVGEDDGVSRFAVLPFESGAQVNGALLDVGDDLGAPPGTMTCLGSSSCPCGNGDGLGGGGCRNSTGHGARLEAVGTNDHASGDLQLFVSQAPPSVSGFFLQGSTPIQLPLGNGLLCVGPPTRRLQFRATDADGEALSTVGLPYFVSPGETVDYQFWFREPGSSGPCGQPSNFSNAYRVTWN